MKAFLLLILILTPFCHADQKYIDRLEGVWKLYKVNGEVFPREFYMKLGKDGTAETWPIPDCWSQEKTSIGKYKATKKEFILVKENSDDISTKYKLKDDKFIIQGRVKTVYILLENPPEPGELLEKGAEGC